MGLGHDINVTDFNDNVNSRSADLYLPVHRATLPLQQGNNLIYDECAGVPQINCDIALSLTSLIVIFISER